MKARKLGIIILCAVPIIFSGCDEKKKINGVKTDMEGPNPTDTVHNFDNNSQGTGFTPDTTGASEAMKDSSGNKSGAAQ